MRATRARRRSAVVGSGPSTRPASTESSTSASASATAARTAGAVRRRGSVRACGVPAPWTSVSGTTCGVRRRRTSSSSASSRAPARSILLTKTSVGSRSRRSVLRRTRVWAWTPSTADSRSTAPSRTSRARSTSAMKSECPGVSIRLIWTSPTVNAATAERIVMPRRLLDLARVGTGVARVDAAEAGDRAGVVEEALGEAGLTGVDVGENADVQGVPRGLGRHGRSSPRKSPSGQGAELLRRNDAFRAPGLSGAWPDHDAVRRPGSATRFPAPGAGHCRFRKSGQPENCRTYRFCQGVSTACAS